MKLSTDEKQTLVAALSHAIAECEKNNLNAAAWSYRQLRKKIETALRNGEAA